MSWTDERVQMLSRLWLEGRSASQIATALGGGLTRNAVIGKVHRLGLAGRVKAAPSALAESDPQQMRASLTELAVAPPLSRRGAGRANPSSPPTASAPRGEIMGNTALAIAATVAEPLRAICSPDNVIVPLSLKVTIVELRESMCRWPIGDPSSPEFRYCGSASKSGTPYCNYHGKLAYQPAQDRRRERDRRPLLAR